MQRTPKLIVFDLDWTLWPFHVESEVTPPFTKHEDGRIVDRRGQKIVHFPEVPQVLERLVSEGYTLAVASRTYEPGRAEQLLELFEWNKYFTYKEIYPGSKKTHFTEFKKASGIDFSDMLFFDDDHRNIRDTVAMGVTAIYVEERIDSGVVQQGLEIFAAKKQK